MWRCCFCFEELEDNKIITCGNCKLLSYCSNRCLKQDRQRHRQYCRNRATRKKLSRKVIYGCAALYRLCCGIVDNPAQAYALALLYRLECPKEFLRYISLAKKNDTWLFEIFKSVNYNVDAYVDTMGTLLNDTLIEHEKTLNVLWFPLFEVIGTIQLNEASIIEKLVNTLQVTPEDACLFIMLKAQSGSKDKEATTRFSLDLLKLVPSLHKRYQKVTHHYALRAFYIQMRSILDEKNILDVD